MSLTLVSFVCVCVFGGVLELLCWISKSESCNSSSSLNSLSKLICGSCSSTSCLNLEDIFTVRSGLIRVGRGMKTRFRVDAMIDEMIDEELKDVYKMNERC